jgi:hypothetical protein
MLRKTQAHEVTLLTVPNEFLARNQHQPPDMCVKNPPDTVFPAEAPASAIIISLFGSLTHGIYEHNKMPVLYPIVWGGLEHSNNKTPILVSH